MSSPEEFLARLDHVVDDYETSDDAMRWLPEPAEPGPSTGAVGTPFGASSLDEYIATRLRAASWQPWPLWRVYVSRNGAEPVGGEGWTEVGTVDADHPLAFTPGMGWRDEATWLAANPPLPFFSLDDLAPWQRQWLADVMTGQAGERVMRMTVATRRIGSGFATFAQALARLASTSLNRLGADLGPSAHGHLPLDQPEDPDRPGHVLHSANGVAAQRSPWPHTLSHGGHSPRGRIEPRPHRRHRHSRRAS